MIDAIYTRQVSFKVDDNEWPNFYETNQTIAIKYLRYNRPYPACKAENLRALSCSEAESEIRKVWMKTRCTESTVGLRKSCCSRRDIVNVSKSSGDHLWPYQCRWRRIATATIKNTTRKWWEIKAYGDGTFLRCNLDGYAIHMWQRV